MGKKSEDVPAKADAPFNSPFAALAGKRDALPQGTAATQPAAAAKAAIAAPKGPARAVVRYERKGHGGKECTRVEQLGLREKDLAAWLKEAKQALGCGGTLDGDTLLLQGDQRERLPAWLTKKHVGKISVS